MIYNITLNKGRLQKKIKPHNVPKKLCIQGKGKDGYCVTNFSKGGIACESCPIKQNSAHGYTEGSESKLNNLQK